MQPLNVEPLNLEPNSLGLTINLEQLENRRIRWCNQLHPPSQRAADSRENELVRHIYLNLLQAGLVRGISELSRCP